MPLWVFIVGAALAGGFLILHGFSKAKEASEGMLDCYGGLLEEKRKKSDDQEKPNEL